MPTGDEIPAGNVSANADSSIIWSVFGSIATVTLNAPGRRNALDIQMFDELEGVLGKISGEGAIHVVLLRGNGPVFCAGFDLTAAANDPTIMTDFIHRLSMLIRMLRRLPQIVVAAVQGAAIAGGCAILSACDFVLVTADATLGYPVHRIGVSPAVTIPTLQQSLGSGRSRALLMSGELIDGKEAHRIGLATHVAATAAELDAQSQAICQELAAKGPYALRTSKSWLNELDGSLEDDRFDNSAEASAELSGTSAAQSLLQQFRGRGSTRDI